MQVQVSFGDAIKMAFEKYAQFQGRSSRSEYWFFVLFCYIVELVAGCISVISVWLSVVASLALFIPQLAIVWRRMHDIGKGGGWYFINLIPLVGPIIFLIWCCKESEPAANRFGEVPNVVGE